ncbi:MAG: DNA polymerase domain-containing protein [Candidatus Thermoplasmatota archaeon]
MLSGNIFDVYLDKNKNKMITWLINNGKSIRIEDSFQPSFYVHSKSKNLYNLANILNDLPDVEKINFTNCKTVLGIDKQKVVLKITPKKIVHIGKLSKMIDSWGGLHHYQLFNVDIRLTSRYLQEKGIFCNAYVKWDGKHFTLNDSQWALDYNIPSFTVANISVKQKSNKITFSFDKSVKSITINDYVIEEENESDTIISSINYLKKIDPDILYIKKGDSLIIPFLYHRADICNISKLVNFGREKIQNHLPLKHEKSYFSYGQIIYRPAFYTFYGRAHIDTNNSFLHNESGFRGLLDISRCSNIPLQLLSRLGAGTAISQMQLNKAIERGYLIPWRKNMPETWKTATKLLNSDRGGLIIDPIVGLHENVFELDFASLYPNVMLINNISPETMLCNCCKNSYNHVPQIGYNICNLQKGIIPEVIEAIIYRRFCFKARSKREGVDKELYRELQIAWKWILLVCFGYTGYRNARFGRIECYESITAFSRDIILTAIDLFEKAGWTILHGIIDSLWIKSSNKNMSPFSISKRIEKRIGIRLELEGHYKWIVFLPSKITHVGALNRYYGLFDNGEIKARGIELRQNNSPRYMKNMQTDMLRIFSKASKSKEFIKNIPYALDVILNYGIQIIKGKINHKDLVFTTRVSKDVSEYKVNNLVKSALVQLKKSKIQIRPGQSIRYIVQDERSNNDNERVCIIENLDINSRIDVDFYLRQLAKCGESILLPFGYKIEHILQMLQKIKDRARMKITVLR